HNGWRLCAGGVFEDINVQFTSNRAKTAWVFANLLLFSKKQAVFCDNRSRKRQFYHLTPLAQNRLLGAVFYTLNLFSILQFIILFNSSFLIKLVCSFLGKVFSFN